MKSVIVELTSQSFKIMVGTIINNKISVSYASILNLPKDTITGDYYVNKEQLVTFLKNNRLYLDEKARVKFPLNEIILILPPVNLERYSKRKLSSNTGSSFSIIELRNLLNMVLNDKESEDHVLVDIIPNFYFNKETQYNSMPKGLECSSMGADYTCYTYPISFYKSIYTSFKDAGIKIRRLVVAPYAAASLVYFYNFLNKVNTNYDFVIADFGANSTSLSLFNGKNMLDTKTFFIGSNLLNEKITNKFNIEDKEAEKLKIHYGYDSKEHSFQPKIINSIDKFEHEVAYTTKDLNLIMVDFLNEYCEEFKATLNELIIKNGIDKPIVYISGGGSKLNGFVLYLKNKLSEFDIKELPLNVIGARNIRYFNMLGALIVRHSLCGSHQDVLDGFLIKNEKSKFN